MRVNYFFLTILCLILLALKVESANIFITSNSTWSSIVSGSGPGGQPDNTDDIFVHGGATLTLDVVGATINSVNLGSNSLIPIGNGTLLFDPGTSLTTSGLINLGEANRRGTIDMTNGGYLTTAGTVLTGNANFATLIAGTGTIEYTGTFLMPNSNQFNVFNEVIISSGTVTTDVTTTMNADFTIMPGGTLEKANTMVFNGNVILEGTWNNTAANITANGNFTMENGAIYNTVAGSTTTLNLAGNLILRGATINRNVTGNGRFIVAGNCLVESGSNVNTGGRWEILGQMDIQAGATFNFNIDATGNFRSLGSLQIGNGATLGFNGLTCSIPVAGNLFMDGGNISGSSIASSVVVSGSATINSGVNTIAGQIFTVTGDLNISSGATLTFNNTNGNKTFSNINVAVGATWNSSVSRTYSITGSLSNDGTFTASSGIYTFSGVAQTIGGSSLISIPNFRVNGAGSSYTNTGSLRIASAWSGNGNLTNGPNAQLDFGGSLTSTGVLDATAVNNTVLYSSGANQTMRSIVYYNLRVTNGGTTNSTGAVTINGDLDLTGGTLDFGGQVTGNATGLISIGPGTRLELGGTGLNFPTNFIAPNIFVDPTSVVRYDGTSASQVISILPVYGFLEIAGGAITKGFESPGVLQVLEDLTITSPTTFNVDVNTIDLSGNLEGTGNIAFLSGTLNISGDWNNSGTFTKGFSTVNWNSSGLQTIVARNFHHLTSSSTGDRVLASTGTIGISGIFTPGTNQYTITGSTVSFNGTSAQTVPAFTFYNHTISNAAGVSLAGNVNLERTLTLSSGVFTTTGFDYVLLSDANYTARIGTITGGSIVGNITMQRFAPGGATGWCLLGAPINETIASWTDDFPSSGFVGASGWAGGFISIYTYNEAAPGLFDDPASYIPVTNATNALTVGRGYWVYLGDGQVTTNDINIEVVGAPHTGNFNFTTTFTSSGGITEDGWNLVSNPYPSAVDWDAAGWTKTRIDNAIYMYQADNGQYASYVAGVGTNGGTRYIASSQGFYVKANAAAPVFRATEAVKVPDNPSLLRTENSATAGEVLRLKLHDNTTGKNDETVLRLHPEATKEYDGNFDALKYYSPQINNSSIALSDDNSHYSIYSTDYSLGHYLEIPVFIKSASNGAFSISFSIENFSSQKCIALIDKQNNSVTPIDNNTSYEFTLNSLDYKDRFVLSVSSAPVAEVISGNCNSKDKGSISFPESNNPWNYSIKTMNGNTIRNGNYAQAEYIGGLESGIYRIISHSPVCGDLESEISILNEPYVDAKFKAEELDNNNWLFTLIGETNGNCTWDFGDGQIIVSRQPAVQHTFEGNKEYLVKLNVDNGYCNDDYSMALSIAEPQRPSFEINQSDGVLMLDLGSKEATLANVRIFSASGSLLLDYPQTNLNPGMNKMILPEMANGIYLVKVNLNGKEYLQKIIR